MSSNLLMLSSTTLTSVSWQGIKEPHDRAGLPTLRFFMTRRSILHKVGITLMMFCVMSATHTAIAQTRLIIPQARFDADGDTQLMASNSNDHDVAMDIWAFSDSGEVVGQYQMLIRAHGTRALLMSEAFQKAGKSFSGWIGASSSEGGIGVSYSKGKDHSEWLDAQAWTSRDLKLNVAGSESGVVRLTNPNAFPAAVSLFGRDSSGVFVGTEDLKIAPFGHIQVTSSSLWNGSASNINVAANAEIVAVIDEPSKETGKRDAGPHRPDAAGEAIYALIIDSPHEIGAYQVTMNYDPEAVEIASKDVSAGTAEGFDSRPLVVNIDNISGQATIGSFQVGATPKGRFTVAHIRMSRFGSQTPRFGLKIDEVSSTLGESLVGKGLSVGLVRIQ